MGGDYRAAGSDRTCPERRASPRRSEDGLSKRRTGLTRRLGAFLDTQTLVDSLADEQADELNAAPSYDYDSAENAAISVNCDPDGYLTYACTGSDTDGDSGYGDIVTVLDNGNAWADTGMNWEGPDVYIDGGVTNYWTTPAQADWQS